MTNKCVCFIIFFIILVSLFADPAPASIDIESVILIILPCLIFTICMTYHINYKFYKFEYDLIIAIILYCAYLLISVLMGLIHGASILNVLRSIGPYLNFFPLLAIGLLPSKSINPWLIACILILVGVLQAGYQIYLYFSHSGAADSTLDVLRGRITLIDPRTTLPIILSLCILPFAFFSIPLTSNTRHFFYKSALFILILLGLFGGIVTLTRAIILSIIFGWMLFFTLQVYYKSRKNHKELLQWLSKFSFYSMLAVIFFILLSLVPKIYMLEQGLLARFFNSSSFSADADYSNGRLFDEWLPALNTWINSDVISFFFGIGAGNAFTVMTGEERTYVHNLLIYSLVYGGIYGFCVCLFLYINVFKVLVKRAIDTQQLIYLGLAALLGSLFFYGQLFAVHKGLAFNAMLFLIIALALYQPSKNDMLKKI